MKQLVITISREFGSGGRQIGEQVAKALGIAFYDRTLVELVSQKSGYSLDFVAENDQRITQSMLFQIAISGSVPPWLNGGKAITNRDTLFSAQCKVIRELASQGGCAIVGRCANYVLRDVPEHLSVFISGALDDKIKRCTAEYGIRPEAAEAEMQRRDRERANYYSHYTGEVWGEAKNYGLAVNSSRFGIEGAAQIILSAVQKL
ncbi:MAG TPA: cytidylate kinase-like family protein [Clostridia bacterium]|nr:cytidylate kinase-like family protein [Clostridia bacterium]